MPFGATNPFPFREGGDAPAEAWSRITADLVASMRVAPLGVMIVAAGVPTAYFGRNGNGVATFDSGATYVLGGTLTYSAAYAFGLAITLGTSWIDEVGQSWAVNIVGADVTGIGTATAATGTAFDRNQVLFTGTGVSDSYVIEIYTDDGSRTIDQYGGDLNKRNSATESDSPYAWGWLLEFRQMRGSAYANDGLIDIENLAWARMFGFLQRVSEQASAATDPTNTSGGRLRRWLQWQAIAILSNDTEAAMRAKASAFKMLKQGSADQYLLPMIQAALGSAYAGVYRNKGTFDSPPVPTYWNESSIPASITTEFSLGVGGGTTPNDNPVWMSERFRLVVIVQIPANQTVQDVINVCESSLTTLLNNALPSVATFEWGRLDTYGGDEGFFLDQSLLDLDLL
jgi:hypothetical protein